VDYTVLICDDDKDILSALQIYLRQDGYKTIQAANGAQAVQAVARDAVHLVLLDIMMPEMDGIAAAVKIRENSNAPIIFLSAKSEDTDRILGLNMGGDDYITKPFNPVELLARVRAALRRYARLGGLEKTPQADAGAEGKAAAAAVSVAAAEAVSAAEAAAAAAAEAEAAAAAAAEAEAGSGEGGGGKEKSIHRTGGLALNDIQKRVTLDGGEVALTALEYNILKLLISNLDRVFTSAQIYEAVWNEPAFHVSKTVSVHIRHIREKIEINPKEPRYLKVIYGLGYKVVKQA
jgi:DNA-binding response OmpR family regulator